MTNFSEILRQIDTTLPTTYPCDVAPGTFYDADGRIQKVITATSQLQITLPNSSEPQIWAPLLYISSMREDFREIRVLTVEPKGDFLCVKTRYNTVTIGTDTQIEVSPWAPTLKKSSCLQCTNCGRCSW